MVTAARFLVVASLALFGCSQGAPPDVAPPSLTQADKGAVVIAQIVTHDAKVAILGGGRYLRVVVRSIDGTMVADGISLADLRARDPELYMVVTSAFASSTSYVDATLDVGHLN
jgi:hypothetical protein